MTLSEAQLDHLRAFERGLDPRRPESGLLPARVLGYGEISTVFEVQADGLQGLALKRLPLFRDWCEVDRYRTVFDEYLRLLQAEIGLSLPRHQAAVLERSNGAPVFYIVQEQVPDACLGHRLLHRLAPEQVPALVLAVLRELRKVWDHNRRQGEIQVAIDGQLSNWALEGALQDDSLSGRVSPLYLDTSTPLYRLNGVEQLDTELFLRSAPSFLAWVLRAFFLKDVVGRYYDFHRVAVDLAANLYKEQRPELIPAVIAEINRFFSGEAAGLGIAPLTTEEVRAYYREDAFIWRFYLAARKIDRALRTRLLRREYPYVLPGRIQR